MCYAAFGGHLMPGAVGCLTRCALVVASIFVVLMCQGECLAPVKLF